MICRLSSMMVAALAAAGALVAPVRSFRHVVVVVFENHERSEIVGSRSAPTFAALARRGATLTGYDAVSHPSLPNYLALVSGSTHGISDDCTSRIVNGPSLADTLAAAAFKQERASRPPSLCRRLGPIS